MAQKFGNGRWVKEGFLDNRVAGHVVGRITFAGVGPVDFYLKGDCRGEIAGKAIRLRNGGFLDEELAAQVLADFEAPQVGEVSLISFDPHPMLSPHPYIEWFSTRKNHYRIELKAGDAWILTDQEAAELDGESDRIRKELSGLVRPTRERSDSDWV
ncbi:MAG: hypothetical protein AB1411_01085 [Nitrospirota bacterium]